MTPQPNYMLLAVADDFRAAHPDDEPIDPDEVYDWLTRKAHEVGEGE